MSKADLKRSQLPVTKSKPYLCVPIPEGDFPDLVPVLDLLGGFICWANEEFARELLKKNQVRMFRTKKKVRALQALEPIDPASIKASSHKHFFGIPHRRETDTNPANVWTLDSMGVTTAGQSNLTTIDDKRARFSRKACMEVVISCTKKAA